VVKGKGERKMRREKGRKEKEELASRVDFEEISIPISRVSIDHFL
jgi:hypothetical protein